MDIVVYTVGPTCNKCKALKLKLEQKHVPYREVTDIEEMQSLNIFEPTLRVKDKYLNFREGIDYINSL